MFSLFRQKLVLMILILAVISLVFISDAVSLFAAEDVHPKKTNGAGKESSQTVKDLISKIKGKDDEERMKASKELMDKGQEAISPLIDLLKSEDEKPHTTAVGLLACIGRPAVEHLIEALKSSNAFQRTGAVSALGKIGDKRAVEPLIPLVDDRDSTVRAFTVEALGDLGDKRAVPVLIKAVDDRQTRQQAFCALEKIGAPSVDELTSLLKSDNSNIRSMTVESLGRIGDKKAAGPVAELLKDKDEDIVKVSITALGNLGSEKAVKALSDLIGENGSHKMTPEAIQALGMMKNAKAAGALIRVFKIDDNNLCMEAVKALGECGEPALTPLKESIGNRNERTRLFSVLALGNINDQRVVDPLIKALGDEKKAVKIGAIKALEIRGDKRALDPLKKLLEDKDETVKSAAKQAIEKLNGN